MPQQILQAALAEAEKEGVYLIGRHQALRETAVVINNGSVERIVTEQSAGLGVQVFTPEGYSGFAANDNPNQAKAREQVQQAARLADLAQAYGGEQNRAIFKAAPLKAEFPPVRKYAFAYLPVADLTQLVIQVNKHLRELFPSVAVQTVYREIEEVWQIVRSDGTAVAFTVPRAVLSHSLTARAAGKSVTTRSAVAGTDVGLLLNADDLTEGNARAELMAGLAVAMLDAPAVKGGSFKLVIDYALAKGLAHEAFGHAVETDGVRTSVLGHNGKLAIGMQVAHPQVSIIDGPLEGDWAYQPISANGIKRETVTIVDKGILAAGLGDVFSAAQAGVSNSGAGRAESFAHIPLPRMSNIRIEVACPIPLAKPWHQVTPKELYTLLLERNLIQPDEEVYYLLGYKGGQVNTQYGDFVFNCSAIYRLGEEPVLYQPGIFAGKTLSALQAIKAGLGNIQCDAIGTCGKWGQAVPSSGGSHAFLVLEANPDIKLGGE